MKLFAIVAVFAVAPLSMASYELMLVVDQSKDSISRFDALTGASLGTFGALQLEDPQSIALIKGTSECLVFDNATDRVNRFNYSTGEYLSSFALPIAPAPSQIIEPLPDGTFLSWGYLTSQLYRITATGGLLNSYSAPAGGSFVSAAGVGPSGEIYAAWVGTNKIHRYGINGATQGVSAVGGPFADGTQMNTNSAFGYFTQSSNTIYKFLPGNPATGIEAVTFAAGTSLFGVAMGHGDLTYACGKDAAGAGVWVLNGATKTQVGKFTPAGITTPVHMAIVVAPEPTTMLALCAGIAALLRRKRR